MADKPSVHDVQNYYLSFFGSLSHPIGETVEEIAKEVMEDTDERQSNRRVNQRRIKKAK